MTKFLLPFFIFTVAFVNSQSLGKSRIAGINNGVVRILIDNRESGTGFVISKDGLIATCEHVVRPSFIFDSNNSLIDYKSIKAKFSNGEIIELEPLPILLSGKKIFDTTKVFDSFILKFCSEKPKIEYKPLKLGSWQEVNEGDIVYTSGYPGGINTRFVSQGLLSTKYTETIAITDKTTKAVRFKYIRDAAWADLTTNRGNSGGPVWKRSANPDEDIVIGIASFIANPNGVASEELYKLNKQAAAQIQKQKDSVLNENQVFIGVNKQFEIIFQSLANNSIGMSGVLSIDYIVGLLRLTNREQ